MTALRWHPEDTAEEEEWQYGDDVRHVLEDGDPAEALMMKVKNFPRKKKQHRCAAWGVGGEPPGGARCSGMMAQRPSGPLATGRS